MTSFFKYGTMLYSFIGFACSTNSGKSFRFGIVDHYKQMWIIVTGENRGRDTECHYSLISLFILLYINYEMIFQLQPHNNTIPTLTVQHSYHFPFTLDYHIQRCIKDTHILAPTSCLHRLQACLVSCQTSGLSCFKVLL